MMVTGIFALFEGARGTNSGQSSSESDISISFPCALLIEQKNLPGNGTNNAKLDWSA